MKQLIKFLPLPIILLFAVNSLSAQSKEYFELSLPEVEIINQEFKQVIESSIGNFEENYKQLPGVLIISIYGDHKALNISIDNLAYLYLDDEDRKWYSESQNFKYISKINNITVLFKIYLKNGEEGRLIKTTGLMTQQTLKYGNFMACCYQLFKYDNKFALNDQYCCFDLYVD